jgi:microcystin-dependent protein
MPGKWDKSGTQRIGLDGRPDVGARCYFFEAASTTPLTTYTDYSLAAQNPAFVETDSYGTWPSVFFDDSDNSFYRERATNAAGSVIYFDNDVIPIVGPGEGGGAPEVPVDPNSVLQTGDIVAKYTTGTKAGFVRANGRTIGSTASGAAERANADTQELFEHLWNADSALSVSGGRGASATADFEANKTISLPDFRGRAAVGLDDMGSSAAGVLTGFTTLGETAGSSSTTLVADQIPQLTSSSNGTHTHFSFANTTGGDLLTSSLYPERVGDFGSESSNYVISGDATAATVGLTSSSGAHTHTVGNSSPSTVPTVTPSRGVTFYIRL